MLSPVWQFRSSHAYLASNLLSTSLFVIHDSRRRRQYNNAKLHFTPALIHNITCQNICLLLVSLHADIAESALISLNASPLSPYRVTATRQSPSIAYEQGWCLTKREGRSRATHASMSTCLTSYLGEITPHLLSLHVTYFSSNTVCHQTCHVLYEFSVDVKLRKF